MGEDQLFLYFELSARNFNMISIETKISANLFQHFKETIFIVFWGEFGDSGMIMVR